MTTERLKELKRLAENYQPALSRMEVDKSELLALIAAVERMRGVVDAAKAWQAGALSNGPTNYVELIRGVWKALDALAALSREGVSNG